MTADALEAMRDSGIETVELTDEQRETFREMSLPAREEYMESAGRPGADILQTLIDEVEQAEKRQ